MPVSSYCRRSVCAADPEETLQSAAERMEKDGVGLLVVMEGDRAAGVLSDRDVALHLAEHRDGGAARVRDAMTASAKVLALDASLAEATRAFASLGVRRLPVVDAQGRPFGVIAADDLLRLVAAELSGLAEVAAAQLPPAAQAPAPAPDEPVLRPADHYVRDVVRLREDADVATAVGEMRRHAVGCVLVTAAEAEAVGILTDRDVAIRVVARGLDPAATPLSAVMSTPVVAAEATAPLEEVIAEMRRRGVRRMPVERDGKLVGIVTFDDLLVALGEELQQLGRAASREVRGEQRRARVEDVRSDAAQKLQDAAAEIGRLGSTAMSALGREIDALRERLRRSRDE